MRSRRWLAVVVPLLLSIGAIGNASADTAAAFVVHDSRINEASGIAVGELTPDVLYVHNDSGDSARFFAIDKASGRTRAEIDVPGATNDDWEDIATSPDVRGVPSVWLADIGDNRETRTSVQIYRVDEPKVASALNQRLTATNVQRWNLRYPDGPHNAEGFTIDLAHQQMYVVTKSESNHTKVFRTSMRPATGERTWEFVADVHFPKASFYEGLNLVTGAAYSPSLRVFVLRTYLAGFFWRVPDGDPAKALRSAPTGFSLPLERQAEGIGFDGRFLWLNSEGTDQPVFRIAVPPAALTMSATSSASSAQQPTDYLPRKAEFAPKAHDRTLAIIGLAVVATLAGCGFAWRRVRRT